MKCWFCDAENLPGADACEHCSEDLTKPVYARFSDPIERELLQRPLSDLATSSYIEIDPNCSLRDTIQRILESGMHCALIIDNDQLVGILTERDVLMKTAERFDDLADQPVRNFMTASPETLEDDAPVAFALNRMTVGGFRHIPIVKDGRAVGLVSVRDVLSFLVKTFPDTIGAPVSA